METIDVVLCLDFYTRLNVTGLALLPFADMSRTRNAKKCF